MNNYISAGLVIAKVVGITLLVALTIAFTLFIFYVIYSMIAAIRDRIRKERIKTEDIQKLQEMLKNAKKLAEAGVFMDIWKKQQEETKHD